MTKVLKKNKNALIASLVLIAFVIAYFKRDIIKDFFSKSNDSKASTAIAAAKNPTANTPTSSNDTVLKMGNSGAQVRKLQQLLNDKHKRSTPQFLPLLIEDGSFGKKTETMLKKHTGKTSISINQLIKALE
jgi:hypothetical protein